LEFEFCILSVQDLCPALETVAFPALISSSISMSGKCHSDIISTCLHSR
jgi:hypothetical protein